MQIIHLDKNQDLNAWLAARAGKYVQTGKLGRQNIRRAIARKVRAGGGEDIEVMETLEVFQQIVNALKEKD
jgi:hypothetical protein